MDTPTKCYVSYLNCKDKFKPTTKDFDTYEKAWAWIKETFENPSQDFIHYY